MKKRSAIALLLGSVSTLTPFAHAQNKSPQFRIVRVIRNTEQIRQLLLYHGSRSRINQLSAQIKMDLHEPMNTSQGMSSISKYMATHSPGQLKNAQRSIQLAQDYINGQPVDNRWLVDVEDDFDKLPFSPDFVDWISQVNKVKDPYRACYKSLEIYTDAPRRIQTADIGNAINSESSDSGTAPVVMMGTHDGNKGIYAYFADGRFLFLSINDLKSKSCYHKTGSRPFYDNYYKRTIVPPSKEQLAFIVDGTANSGQFCDISINDADKLQSSSMLGHCTHGRDGLFVYKLTDLDHCTLHLEHNRLKKILDDKEASAARQSAVIRMIQRTFTNFREQEEIIKNAIANDKVRYGSYDPKRDPLNERPNPRTMIDFLKPCARIPDPKVKEAVRNEIQKFKSLLPDPSKLATQTTYWAPPHQQDEAK